MVNIEDKVDAATTKLVTCDAKNISAYKNILPFVVKNSEYQRIVKIRSRKISHESLKSLINSISVKLLDENTLLMLINLIV